MLTVEGFTMREGKALVEVHEKGTDESVTMSGIVVVHGTDSLSWQPELDWERGTVLAIADDPEFEPVTVGDEVLVRAPSGGVAGVDVGRLFDRRKGEMIVVDVEEIVCKIER